MFTDEIDRLGIFYRLPGNWNQRGANTVGFDAVLRSMQIITMIFCEYGQKPYYMEPTTSGGVSIEYRDRGAKIEIEISDKEENFAYLIDLGSGKDDERYFIEENVPLENLIYRLGQIVAMRYEEEEEKQ